MFQNYVNIAFRNLFKHKLYSLINILGLGVGLAACILITMFVRDELNYDTFWSNADSIQRMHTTFNVPGREPFVTVVAMGPAKEAITTYFDEEIEYSTRFNGLRPIVKIGDKSFDENVHWTDPETAEIFDFDMISGDMRETLRDTSSIAINETMAKKYFGDQDPMGKVMTLTVYGLQRDYRVTAVFRDLPHNTVLDFQALVKIVESDFEENFSFLFSQWFSVNNNLFFKLRDGVNPERVTARWDEFADNGVALPLQSLREGTKPSDFIKFSSMPIKDIQLNAVGGGEMKPTGSMMNVIIFSSIAALILVIASINFMNLATAKSTQRAREVALRKVLGASRVQLLFQFLGESILLALCGLVLGLVLVELTSPLYSDFIGKDLVFSYVDPFNLSIIVGLVLTVGIVGGIYPAAVISGFRPAQVLKANKSAETSGSAALRSGLVIFQFAISIALIIAAAAVYGQQKYATNIDPGFNRENLIAIPGVSRRGMVENQQAFKEEVLRLPGVVSAAYSFDRPSTGNESNVSVTIPGAETDQSILIGRQDIDFDFVSTYQIKLLAGRLYDRNVARDSWPSTEGVEAGQILEANILVNKTALAKLGFGTPEEAIGRVIRIGRGEQRQQDMTIIGVLDDTKFQSVRRQMRPELYPLSDSSYLNLTVRYSGDGAAMADQIRAIWERIAPDVPFNFEFVTESVLQEFTEEERTATLLAVFSGLAVLVACLGLYGLASFTAERRTKEIGVRKVMGATVLDIVRLLLWQFSRPVLIANLIAWPVALWGLSSWLEEFPYRMDFWMLLPMCAGAGAIALIIAWGTVGGNAAKVARRNPITALRYE
ncbi:ABC transporter permease [Kordiimonas sediminis]|uniref:ABC transporter permease n=1 Tax=Kordiimonas sediminis TaxID=1735581 RepID=A0A919E756_9PROT|nr:ABC transporter permease [Kordiimonas sediminis]GHF19938.1 ABC transporter permease [Kordiimonas sediminis]